MMICLAIGGSTALGCVFETSSEPDTTTEGPIAANQGEGSAQTPPALAVYRYQRGKTLMEPPEVRDLSAVDDVTEALKRCIDKDPNFIECVRSLAVVKGPHPVCPACEATAARVGPEQLLIGERISRR